MLNIVHKRRQLSLSHACTSTKNCDHLYDWSGLSAFLSFSCSVNVHFMTFFHFCCHHHFVSRSIYLRLYLIVSHIHQYFWATAFLEHQGSKVWAIGLRQNPPLCVLSIGHRDDAWTWIIYKGGVGVDTSTIRGLWRHPAHTVGSPYPFRRAYRQILKGICFLIRKSSM